MIRRISWVVIVLTIYIIIDTRPEDQTVIKDLANFIRKRNEVFDNNNHKTRKMYKKNNGLKINLYYIILKEYNII